MCKKDHRELINQYLTDLVSKGGGMGVCCCKECGKKFVVSYKGPSGLFLKIDELGGE